MRDSVIRFFQDALLHELMEAVMKSNVFVSATSEGAELSTTKCRETFLRSNYPLVMLVQYNVDSSGHTAVYVPLLQILQTMFKTLILLTRFKKPNHLLMECK